MSDAQTAGRPLVDYNLEQRMAVVMYGGVSLAIYIGGVASELLAVVRASAPDRADGKRAGVAQLSGSEKVYRKLAQWDAAKHKTWDDLRDGDPLRTRFVVDVISGTSAGGINGVFLARALAEGRTLDAVRKLWIEEGDLHTLLNDKVSVAGVAGLKEQKPPVALLNGQRMYKKLSGAFATMEKGKGSPDPGERVDLFVTTTDVRGEVVRLPLANGYATEKRYRQAFHFVYEPDSTRNDFADGNEPQLAFAARCTSSFPFAFEPFTWNDAARLTGGTPNEKWMDNLLYHSGNYAARPLCDGGYLDNKPFSYVADEMARRHSELPARRTLFYVEPDPESIDDGAQRELQQEKPDAIENALNALISLPGYETIREDIERVLDRNDRVQLLQKITQDIDAHITDPDTAKAQNERSVAYRAYHMIKIESVKDWFAELVCAAARVSEARLQQVVRKLVSLWAEEYRQKVGDRQFLLDLDFGYRMRKVAFLLRRANDAATRAALKKAYNDLHALQRTAREDVAGGVVSLFNSPELKGQLEAVAEAQECDAAIAQLLKSIRATAARPNAASVEQLDHFIETTLRPQMRKQAAQLAEILATPAAGALRRDAQVFEQYDMVLFPLLSQAAVGEPVRVDVARISPLDAKTGGGSKKLMGTKFAHFGAFLEDDWRKNDMLWGRLDGAEIVIRQMLRNVDKTVSEQVITDAIAEAHEAIIEDLCVELAERMTSYATSKNTPADVQIVTKAQLEDKAAMVQYFAEGNGYDRGVDRARQASNATRAAVIVEKLVGAIADEKKAPLPRIVGTVMSFLSALVQISIPGTTVRALAKHAGTLLFIGFALLAVGGEIFHAPEVRSLGIDGSVFIAATAILSSIIADWISKRGYWRAGLKALGIFLLLSLAFVTTVTLWRDCPAAFRFISSAWTSTGRWLSLLQQAVPLGVILTIEGVLVVLSMSMIKVPLPAARD